MSLAGHEFETFLLDVGWQPEPRAGAETLTTPDLLAFAGLDPVAVPAIPLELQIAEKLHAYSRTYEGTRRSTRAKDLVDLVLIAELSPLDAASLHRAIEGTFAGRGTHPVPAVLPSPPHDWRAPFAELAMAVGVATDLATAHDEAAHLLDPILEGSLRGGIWDVDERRWAPD